jgi:hypothetical protein
MPTYLDERAMELSRDWGEFALIRPCTLRKEWPAPARNCKWQYINKCAEVLKHNGVKVIEVADIDDENELLIGDDMGAYDSFTQGQLSPMLIASLMKLAVVTVAPVGFVLPMGIATNSPTFNIFGGYLSPDVMVDDRMDLSNYGFAAPEPFCYCYDRKHESCHKKIPKLTEAFTNFLNKVHVPKTMAH